MLPLAARSPAAAAGLLECMKMMRCPSVRKTYPWPFGKRCRSSGQQVSDPCPANALMVPSLPLPPSFVAGGSLSCILLCAGHAVMLVGGAVRDLLLGCKPKDYDLLTSAHIAEVLASSLLGVAAANQCLGERGCSQTLTVLHCALHDCASTI
jgi:hypothetical protein